MDSLSLSPSDTNCNDDYTGAVCLLHKLTPLFPVYEEILVDADDFAELVQHQWTLAWVGGQSKGSVRQKQKRVWTKGCRYLSIVIMKPPEGMKVDHRSGQKLDNRRSNLRICTHAENNLNTKRQSGSSRFKGVYRVRDRWYAQAGKRGSRVFLGSFANERDAALAYNDFAKREYGEFAFLNPV